MRDKIKPESYWASYINACDRRSNEDIEDASNKNNEYGIKIGSASGLKRRLFRKLSAAYSAGYAIADLEPLYRDFMEGFGLFLDVAKEKPERVIEDYFFAYDDRTRYLALAILFDADPATVSRLVEAVDFWPGKDAIWERMIAHLGVTGRPPVQKVQWPEAYDALNACFTPYEGNRPALLKIFVDAWYKEMGKGDSVWVGWHKNKHDIYFGYWCFEAAGVAKMLNIDDSALKDHPHYPYDLVHPPVSD